MKPAETDLFWITWFKNRLQKGNFVQIRANGNSMIPCMWKGDLVRIYPLSLNQIGLGDIVAFQRNQHFVVHRVISIQNISGKVQLCTQGDSNRLVDEPIDEQNFIGKVDLLKPSKKTNKIPSQKKRILFFFLARFLSYFDALKKRVKKLLVR
jgi:signal peptidase I